MEVSCSSQLHPIFSMKESLPHTAFSRFCMEHTLSELVPSARVQTTFSSKSTYTIVFSTKDPISPSLAPYLEKRANEIASKTTVRGMLEGNARDYLESENEKKLAVQLKKDGNGLVSLCSLFGQTYVEREDFEAEGWNQGILCFEQLENRWLLVGFCRETAQQLNAEKQEMTRKVGSSFQVKGLRQKYLEYTPDGVVWLERGIRDKEALQDEVRGLYASVGLSEKEYPKSGTWEVGHFSFQSVQEPLFSKNRCKRDCSYFTGRDEKITSLLEKMKVFFEQRKLAVYEKKGKGLFVKDIFGSEWKVSEMIEEKTKQGVFTKISLLFSVERVCALMLERI